MLIVFSRYVTGVRLVVNAKRCCALGEIRSAG